MFLRFYLTQTSVSRLVLALWLTQALRWVAPGRPLPLRGTRVQKYPCVGQSGDGQVGEPWPSHRELRCLQALGQEGSWVFACVQRFQGRFGLLLGSALSSLRLPAHGQRQLN